MRAGGLPPPALLAHCHEIHSSDRRRPRISRCAKQSSASVGGLGRLSRRQGPPPYSSPGQNTPDNLPKLQGPWTYDHGERREVQSNALVVNGVLYTASPTRKVIALDAATGVERWKWDASAERPGNPGNRQRGLVYWADGDDRRIFTGVGQYLYALKAETGEVIRT